ncbi:MAG: TrkH family potassium uptake protein [Treponema sp.]|nr:TrkH family potassium uptake protein [Treponema sp.]
MKKQFILIFLIWLSLCFLGALPYYCSGVIPRFTDAFFESVSGFTTTGATVLSDIEALPAWLLFWRSLTQWLGGMGIIVLGIALFPVLSTDSLHHKMKKSFFRMKPAAGRLLALYITLTALQTLLLHFFGMNWFDAVTHAFSTISTGGFSVKNSSIAFFNSPAIEWICIIFMFLAGLNFMLILLLFFGNISSLRNSEARTYTAIVIAATLIVTLALLPQSPSAGTAARRAFFHVTSMLSTSGMAAADISQWPSAAQGILFLLMFIGGCSGSAAGGIKIIRYVILSKQTWKEMKRIINQRRVVDFRLDGRSAKKEVVNGVAGFVFLYFVIVFLGALLVSSSGAGVFTSLNAAVICQGNIGAGLGEFGAFMPFPDFPVHVKWALSFLMIAGRFELWIILALFNRDFWRK